MLKPVKSFWQPFPNEHLRFDTQKWQNYKKSERILIDSIVVYQAYNKAIAEPALGERCFVSPFSFNRKRE